ncbi:MAG: GDSL-type esterase/lipase family protein [Ruminiclostridium sp.]
MARKSGKFDGISAAIVILNILIVGVIITLCALIYLYMSGKLEETDVSNLGQDSEPQAVITTTQITTVTSETEPPIETTTTPEETTAPETPETEEIITAVESDVYEDAFFANDLFIGDSIGTGLVNYGYLTSEQVFAQIGLNPESARTKEYGGYTAVTRAKELQPKRIYIMLGSNGLAYMGNTYMTEQMKLLVDELKENCPESYIYVISIPPVTKVHDNEGQETMVMVNGYNRLLKDMCDENAVVYLDLCSQLQDSTGYFSDKYAEADGLHFLGTAYKKMLSFLQKSIQVE